MIVLQIKRQKSCFFFYNLPKTVYSARNTKRKTITLAFQTLVKMQPYEKYSHLTSLSQPQNFCVPSLNQNQYGSQSCQCVYGITGPGVSLTSTATTKKSFSIDSILGTRKENTESFTPSSDPIMQTSPVPGPGSIMRDRNLCEFSLVPTFGQYGNLGFPDFLTSEC